MRFLSDHPYNKWIAHFLTMGFIMLYPFQSVLSQRIAVSSESSFASARLDTSRQEIVILNYSETLGGMREAMQSASLTIFSDGYMLIFRPAYMKQAGTYGTYLESNVFDRLWQMLTDRKILEFDAIDTRNKIQQVKQQQAGSFSIIHSISDAPTTLIEIYPNRYQSSGMFEQGDWDAKKNISWYGLKWTAEQFPNIEEIQYLLLVQQELRALMERSDLKKIK